MGIVFLKEAKYYARNNTDFYTSDCGYFGYMSDRVETVRVF